MIDSNKPIGMVKRREFLRQGTLGIGSLALSHLMTRDVEASGHHHPPRAKNVIFLHMVGGPSQMDTFDPKPALDKWDGRSLPDELTRGQKFAFITPQARAIKSPYAFKPRGKSGTVMSELFPHLATVADDIAVIRSMRTNEINHGSGELFFHTGHGRMGRPSFGAWTTYGLGTENRDLPAYVVLKDGPTAAGTSVWSSGFLSSRHQGVEFRQGRQPIHFLDSPEFTSRSERSEVVDAIKRLNQKALERYRDPEIATRISQYELAYRMQTSVPDLVDLTREPEHILRQYGLRDDQGQESGSDFARNCLLARRLVEKGVRFVQLYQTDWDHHGLAGINLGQPLDDLCRQIDRPSVALIKDLKQRGMLDDTLVIWGGEFGRTPQGEPREAIGRDHHIETYAMWLAGGGVKGGQTLGETDDLGYYSIRDPVHVHDLQATILHLLGLDHKRLIYRFQGRDFRLTDVAGEVVEKLLA